MHRLGFDGWGLSVRLEGVSGEEVAEEGFEDGGGAADETGVDFDDAVGGVSGVCFCWLGILGVGMGKERGGRGRVTLGERCGRLARLCPLRGGFGPRGRSGRWLLRSCLRGGLAFSLFLFFPFLGRVWSGQGGGVRNPAHEHQDQSNLFFPSEPQLVHHGQR